MSKNFVLSKQGFTGLDQRSGCSTGIDGLPGLLNFKVNESGHLEKRNGYSLFGSTAPGKYVTNLWHGDTVEGERIIAACTSVLYEYDPKSSTFIDFGETLKDASEIFVFQGKLYVLGGDMYEINGEVLSSVSGYIPLVATACTPSGAGTTLEKPNLLSNSRRVRYNGDGTSPDYTLPESGIASVDSITVDGEAWTGQYNAHCSSGIIEFSEPLPQGINNIEIQYSMPDNEEWSDKIRHCRHGLIFENRLFLYDNKDHPEYMFHSELADGIPSAVYFTETGYHVFDEDITSLTACYNRLMIFFENSSKFTYAELQTDSLGNVYTSFPVYQLNSTKGHILRGNGASFDNTPVTLSNDGINKWVSTVISDERSAKVFSERVFRAVSNMIATKEDIRILNRRSACELWFCHTTGTLIYNYSSDCFYFYDFDKVVSLTEYGYGVLLGMADGNVYLFSSDSDTDNGKEICAEFETPYCTFGTPYALKSLNGVSLTVSGNEALEFEMTVSRGNGKEQQELKSRLRMAEIETKGFRRIRERLHLSRFFSCKLKFATKSKGTVITELHLFGKTHGGNIRLN